MEPFFTGDTYDTPEDMPLGLADRILLKSRWAFYFRFIRVVFRYRSLCVKGKDSDELWAWNSYEITKAIERSGGRWHIEGINNLKNVKEPLVVISNHMSAMETQTLPAMIEPYFLVTFIVKKSLITHPVFGPIMRSRNPVAVGRVNPREDFQTVLTDGTKLLEKGISIIVFPQASRHDEFIPEKFNSLGVKLAKRAGVKVLPVALKTDFWGNGKRIKDFGPIDRSKPIHVAFGEPMTIKGNGSEQHLKCVEFVQSHLERWKV